jgi:alanyl-tRNA synthetase
LTSSTERLYYTDAYVTRFQAHTLEDGARVVLDRTAFYPTSGGQPHDLGRIGDSAVLDVIDEDDRIVHVLAGPIGQGAVNCEIDWSRRFDHMQQHTGQHLLSAVFSELYGIATISFHMGSTASTIDLACPALTREQMISVEDRANELIYENRPVSIAFEEAEGATGLRKASDRSGPLRIITIDGLDRSACGGTHVRSTGEIGSILLRGTEKIRGNVRLEFLCGGRAVRRARADFTALESSARAFSSSLDEVPTLVAAQAERLKDIDRTRRRLETELAEYRGRELYSATAVGNKGLKIATRVFPQGPFPEDLRPEATAFVAGGKAVYIGMTNSPPSIMLVCAADSGLHAGNVLKALLAETGGKGGGSAQLAQGNFTASPESVLNRLMELLVADV